MHTTETLLAEIEASIASWASPKSGRLPSERALARRLGVSRPHLRKVLSMMEEQGRIQRHVGRGTFLKSLPESPAEVVERTALKTSPRAAMEARQAVEPQLAWIAAQNATLEQIRELQRLCSAMEASRSWEEYAELDWRFHNVIAEATANVLLAEIQHLLNSVRRRVVWEDLDTSSVRPPSGYHSFAEHAAVVAAIAAHKPAAAKAAMQAHLDGTQQRLLNGHSPPGTT